MPIREDSRQALGKHKSYESIPTGTLKRSLSLSHEKWWPGAETGAETVVDKEIGL